MSLPTESVACPTTLREQEEETQLDAQASGIHSTSFALHPSTGLKGQRLGLGERLEPGLLECG